MSNLHQQLNECVREIESVHESIKYAEALALQLAIEEQALEVLEKSLTKEQGDVHVLERENVISLIRKIIGDREERLEKEKEEYLKVSGRHIELYKTIELLRYELGILKNKEESLGSLELKMDILLREREKEMKSFDPITAEVLRDLDEKRNRLDVKVKEIEKLMKSGIATLVLVTRIENHLSEARELWIGSEAGSIPMTYDCLGMAQRALQKTNQSLLKFQRGLEFHFPEIHFEAKIKLEKFGKYQGINFNIFFGDFSFREKINNSLRDVRDVREQLEMMLRHVEQSRDEIIEKQAEIEEERKRVIISTNRSAPNP